MKGFESHIIRPTIVDMYNLDVESGSPGMGEVEGGGVYYEQQNAIEHLAAKLQDCCSNAQDDNSTGPGDAKGAPKSATGMDGAGEDGPVLFQNSPNPFTERTAIGYYVPEDAGNATLYVFTLGGVLVKTFALPEKGSGNVVINGSTLSAGMYVYSLVVDGQIVDTKRMILTE